MGRPACRSRYIDDVWVEPFAVSMARAFVRNASLGGCPAAVTVVTTSSRNRSTVGTPPAASISPMLPRSRQVIPPSVASRTHFSHISRSIVRVSRASKPAPCMVASS